MKTRSLQRLGLLLLVSLATTVASPAQSGRHPHEGHPGGREVKAYFEANIQPVLLRQRQQLEQQLAAPDRAQLATYRAQLKELKEKGQALRQSLLPAADAAAQREQLYQLRQESRGIMLSVGALARKYEASLIRLAAEMQPQKDKWTADMKSIALKNATPEQHEHLAQHGGHRPGHGGTHRFFRPVPFLLMEPAAAESPGRILGATSFYPNPVVATSQLDYEVKKAGPVTVNLLDQNGTRLRTLVQEANAEKGAHTQPLDLRDLPAGTYYYQIVTGNGKETKRFVKE